MISKRRQTFSLHCKVPLTVLTFRRKDNFAKTLYPYFLLIFVFLLLFFYQQFGNFDIELYNSISAEIFFRMCQSIAPTVFLFFSTINNKLYHIKWLLCPYVVPDARPPQTMVHTPPASVVFFRKSFPRKKLYLVFDLLLYYFLTQSSLIASSFSRLPVTAVLEPHLQLMARNKTMTRRRVSQ